MRRPLSIMRASPRDSWIELLYKAVGTGTRLLASKQPGERLSLLGPIGRPFQAHPEHLRPLLIGGGVGIPPMIFLADTLRSGRQFRPFAVLGSEIPFPFQPHPSQYLVPGLPPPVIAAMPLLDDWAYPVGSRVSWTFPVASGAMLQIWRGSGCKALKNRPAPK